MFTPFGNMMRLPDGRVLVKNANGAWIDQMTGSQYNPQTMRDMMYSATYDIPDGGRGKKTPMWVIGVAGSVTITNWLNDAKNGVDSLDMVFIGDSNVGISDGNNYEAQGLADNFILAGICSGIRMYGGPIQPMGGQDVVLPYNALGYKHYTTSFKTDGSNGFTSGIAKGPALFANEYGIGTGQLSPNGMTKASQICGYAYVPTDQQQYNAAGGGAVWQIANNSGETGLDVANNFYMRLIMGATANNQTGGKFKIYGFDYLGSRYVDTSIQLTGGFTAYEVNFTQSNNVRNGTAYTINFGQTNVNGFTGVGPIALATVSLYNKVKGMATSALAHMPGFSLGFIYDSLQQAGTPAGNNTVKNYCKEYYNRQIKAGGSGRVCFVIEGGINPDSSTSATVDYAKNIVSFLTSEWSAAGLPSNKLTFLCMNTWESLPSSTWTTNLPTIANSMNNYATTTSNVTYVNMLKLGGTYTGLTAGGYYLEASAVHLTRPGYKYISQNIIDALLKSGRNTFRG